MEQYWMPKKLDFENLRYCLDNYTVNDIFIRLIGSAGGTVRVKEKLESRVLDFYRNNSGITFLIDKKEILSLPLKDYANDSYQKGFSLAYERFNIEDGIKRMVFGDGKDPYDSKLPEPEYSVLRTVWDDNLVEIGFKGRIDIEFHSWWDKPHWKYWNIKKNR